ncbi:MAG: hypothetical protein AB7U20_06465 [Planctomycetaceae bacterium]
MTTHIDMAGQSYDLDVLDVEERRLLNRFKRLANRCTTAEYRNRSLKEIAALYESRGLSRREILQTPLYKILQDVGNRRQVERGEARAPDYRDQLEELVRTRFPTRRAFCEATGLSEDMLSHVLSRRKHLSVDRLSEALERIGYAVTISRLTRTG